MSGLPPKADITPPKRDEGLTQSLPPRHAFSREAERFA